MLLQYPYRPYPYRKPTQKNLKIEKKIKVGNIPENCFGAFYSIPQCHRAEIQSLYLSWELYKNSHNF